jgi:hypothetical protein
MLRRGGFGAPAAPRVPRQPLAVNGGGNHPVRTALCSPEFDMSLIGLIEEREVAGAVQARAEAIRVIRELLAAELSATGVAELVERFAEVRDAQGIVLASVPFREALDFGGREATQGKFAPRAWA